MDRCRRAAEEQGLGRAYALAHLLPGSARARDAPQAQGGGGQDLGVHVGGSKDAGGGVGCPKAVHVALVVHSRHHPPRQVGLAATPSASANPPACAWERACVRACAWECGSKTAWAGPRAHGSGQGGAGRAHSKDAHTQRHLMAAKQETDLLRAMAWSMAYISRRRPPKKPE